MSDYGMQIFNESGQTRLSIFDRTFRLVDVFTVAQNIEGSKVIAGIGSRGAVALSSTYNQPITNLYLPHNVSVVGDNVSYSKGPVSNYPYGPSIIWVYATL